MAWNFPTVLGILALAVGSFVLAQDVENPSETAGSKKWVIANAEGTNAQESTFSADQSNDQSQDISSPSDTSSGDDIALQQADTPAATEQVVSNEDADTSEVDEAPTPDDEDDQQQAVQDLVEDSSDTVDEPAIEPVWEQDGPELLSPEEQAKAEKIENAQRRYNLEQQFAKLQKTLQTADAFSLDLAEDYFGYGLLLRESGQYDEALEAFIDALHIQKVNHGIYSPEQRPVLKALFETHYALGNVEDFEDYLERILWVESKNPDLKDDFSLKMLVMVGNQYIDTFLKRPIAGQSSVQTLLRAKHHLNAAFKRHKDKPLSVAIMPYGELALISYLESQLLDDVDKTASMEDPRLRGSRNLDGRELALSSYLANSYPRGTGLLRSYLKKAQTEENLPHVVRALISLGDFNQLYRRHSNASEYYKMAWRHSQELPADSEVREMFRAPVQLPAFKYSVEREPVLPTRPTINIPLIVDIGVDGRVQNVRRGDESEETKPYFKRARRIARLIPFRPQIVDGEPQASTDVMYEQRVYRRRGS